MTTLMLDVRYALRQLRNTPAFTTLPTGSISVIAMLTVEPEWLVAFCA
jgi:hypothetical protein